MARSKAYLYGGVEIRWHCAKELLKGVEDVPEKATFHFAEGLKDYLAANLAGAPTRPPDGDTQKSGLRPALVRGLKDHAARAGQEKRAAAVTSEDVMVGSGCMLSVFIREPEFHGQTKD